MAVKKKQTTLNRFPLFGLWTKCAAERIGFAEDEAQSLGHAYAVLFAYRAQGGGRGKPKPKSEGKKVKVGGKEVTQDQLRFGGDSLAVRTVKGRLRGNFGGQLQSPETYAKNIAAKFRDGWLAKLEAEFAKVLAKYEPAELNSRLLYRIYDQWKKECRAGRSVDLAELVAWCRERAKSAA